MTFVVTGQPGAGKSTIAKPLAGRMGLSLLAKDTVKEALAVLSDPATITVEKSWRQGGLGLLPVLCGVGLSLVVWLVRVVR